MFFSSERLPLEADLKVRIYDEANLKVRIYDGADLKVRIYDGWVTDPEGPRP